MRGEQLVPQGWLLKSLKNLILLSQVHLKEDWVLTVQENVPQSRLQGYLQLTQLTWRGEREKFTPVVDLLYLKE